jgi:lysophospholipase-2
MMLAGFSQGGAMSLFTGLQLPAEQQGEGGVQAAPALAGIIVMSGYLPGAGLLLFFLLVEMRCVR